MRTLRARITGKSYGPSRRGARPTAQYVTDEVRAGLARIVARANALEDGAGLRTRTNLVEAVLPF